MKRKRSIVLLAWVLLAVAGMGALRLARTGFPFEYKDEILGIAIVSGEEVIQGKEKLQCTENPGILFGGTILPYDSGSNTLYLPQKSGTEEWVGTLRAEGDFFLCAPEEEWWYRKQEAIEEGHGYVVWMAGKDSYYECNLVITGTPVISVHTERQEEPPEITYEEDPDQYVFGSETLYYGKIEVFDPEMAGEGYTVTEAGVCYHLRGATAMNFDKKSYSLDLLDRQGQKTDLSLLGMRKDNSWKLNALYLDQNRLREKTAAQIWEAIDLANENTREPGPRMEYAELVLDDEYRGLYCLVEPVDRKQLQLGGEDVLYKVLSWDVPRDEDIQESVDRGWKVQYPVRIRYPREINDYGATWAPMREFLKLFYGDGEIDYEAARKIVDVENAEDFMIFLMAVSACDNHYKNSYFAASREGGQYVMRQIPWDLDDTFGNVWWLDTDNAVEFCPQVSPVYMQNTIRVLLEGMPEDTGASLWEKWASYRKSILGTEVLCGLLVENRDYLVRTGAGQREAGRWPEANVSMDIEDLLEFQKNRMAWLDTFFDEMQEK